MSDFSIANVDKNVIVNRHLVHGICFIAYVLLVLVNGLRQSCSTALKGVVEQIDPPSNLFFLKPDAYSIGLFRWTTRMQEHKLANTDCQAVT